MPTYAITGANRGIGLEFSRQITSKPGVTLFAGVRSLSGELDDLKALQSKLTSSKIHIFECDTATQSSIESFAKEVGKVLGTEGKLNYLLHNAATNAQQDATVLDFDREAFTQELTINVLGLAKLTEALYKYLGKGSVIMNMSSGLGSMQSTKNMVPTKCPIYSISKAAVNMLSLHQAETFAKDGITVIVMNPGWVITRMGGEGAFIEPHVSIAGMLSIVHGATEKDSGKFFNYDGATIPW